MKKLIAWSWNRQTGEIARFPSVGNYASYCRMVDSKRESNGKKKGEGNKKNGNKYLCWAFIEAANFAIRYNEVIKSYYQRKLKKTNRMVAIKTVAHKLARACFYVINQYVIPTQHHLVYIQGVLQPANAILKSNRLDFFI